MGCERWVLNTIPKQPELEGQNLKLIRENKTGYWKLASNRNVLIGDAIFVILPNMDRSDGYPRELFGGVVSGIDRVGDKVVFKVKKFTRHAPIEINVKEFLGGRVPPQGDRVGVVWGASDEKPSVKSFQSDMTDFEQKVCRIRKLTPEQIEDKIKSWPRKPELVERLAVAFERNPYVVAAVLNRAGNRCESCGKLAPFIRKSDGSPYLEVHHKKFLSEGGEDTVKNAIALCPNCHRKCHFGRRDC